MTPSLASILSERGAAHVIIDSYHANIDRVFRLGEIAETHRYTEASQATGKVVVVTDAGHRRPGTAAPW